MNVAQLKSELEGLPDDMLVVMSRDSEGNGFGPLAAIETNSRYQAHNGWSGEVGLKEITPDLKERGYTEEDLAPASASECVVLWP